MILLEKLRKEAGLSQRKLGRACQPEVDPSYICNAERHGFRLYPTQAKRIAAALCYEGDPADLFEAVE